MGLCCDEDAEAGAAPGRGNWGITSRHGLIAAVLPGVWVAANECDAPRRTHGLLRGRLLPRSAAPHARQDTRIVQ